jgi:hypothetical protein
MVVMGEGTWTTRPQFIWVGLSAVWLQPQHRRPTQACCSSHRVILRYTSITVKYQARFLHADSRTQKRITSSTCWHTCWHSHSHRGCGKARPSPRVHPMTRSGVRASLPDSWPPGGYGQKCPGTRRFLEARPLWTPRFDTEHMRNNYCKMCLALVPRNRWSLKDQESAFAKNFECFTHISHTFQLESIIDLLDNHQHRSVAN